jgi:acetyl coenzyme A synthetase (ADP forming)-like protein
MDFQYQILVAPAVYPPFYKSIQLGYSKKLPSNIEDRGFKMEKMKSARYSQGLRMFFEPKGVAVVGASRTPGKMGNTILRNIIKLGYAGQVFPVNPNASEIDGLKCYPSVAEIPEEVDLVVIAIPASLVLEVMKDCQKKGVKGVVVISSGFSESGEEGRMRQRELVRLAREAGIRVIGPNTTGVLNPEGGFSTTFVDLQGVKPGGIGFIAQTGMFAGMMFQWIFSSQHFGLSKVIGLGNKADVTDHDALDYLAEDESTKVVIMYLEGVKDGKRFFHSAARLVRRKPLVLIKGGKTQEGARAAQSHTGSLVGRDEIFDALCNQVGAIRVQDFEDLLDLGKTFSYQPLPRGNRLAIISLSGGAGVLSTDACLESGLAPAHLRQETVARLNEKMPDWAQFRNNPLDIEPLSETVGREEAYRISLDDVLSDPGVDLALVIMSTIESPRPNADYVIDVVRAHPDKPVAVCIIGEATLYQQLFKILEEAFVPVFVGVRRAVVSLAALHRYRRTLNRLT